MAFGLYEQEGGRNSSAFHISEVNKCPDETVPHQNPALLAKNERAPKFSSPHLTQYHSLLIPSLQVDKD